MWGLAMANASSNLRQDLQVGKEPLIFQNGVFFWEPQMLQLLLPKIGIH